jgi:hypothetical protein
MGILFIILTSVIFLVTWFICNYFIFKKELPSNVSFKDGLAKSIQDDLVFLLRKSSLGLKFMNLIGKPL